MHRGETGRDTALRVYQEGARGAGAYVDSHPHDLLLR